MGEAVSAYKGELEKAQAELATAKRVAEEAMRMLDPAQLAELAKRLDALDEGGSEHGEYRGDTGRPGGRHRGRARG
jgi:hypothetical protein